MTNTFIERLRWNICLLTEQFEKGLICFSRKSMWSLRTSFCTLLENVPCVHSFDESFMNFDCFRRNITYASSLLLCQQKSFLMPIIRLKKSNCYYKNYCRCGKPYFSHYIVSLYFYPRRFYDSSGNSLKTIFVFLFFTFLSRNRALFQRHPTRVYMSRLRSNFLDWVIR